MVRMSRKTNIIKLLSIHELNAPAREFYNIFLSVFFLKVTNYDIRAIALFYIVSYIVSPFVYLLLGNRIKQGHNTPIYRVGIILNVIFLGMLVIVKDNLVDYIHLTAILSGISTYIYWLPYESLTCEIDQNRNLFIGIQEGIEKLLGIILPIVMGICITASSYEIMLIIISVITIISLILSISLDKDKTDIKQKLEMKNFHKKICRDKSFYRVYIGEFFRGITHGGAFTILIQIILFLNIDSELNYGTFNSIIALLTVIFSIIISKCRENQKQNNYITLLSGMVFIISIIMFFIDNDILWIVYSGVYNILYRLIHVVQRIIRYQVLDENGLKEYKIEHLIITEFALNVGRVIGFVFLSLFNGNLMNNLIIMSFVWLLLSINFIYNRKHEKIINES